MTLEEGLKNSTPFCTTECVEGVPLSWDQTRVKLMNWIPNAGMPLLITAQAKSPSSSNKLLGPEPNSRGWERGSSELGWHCSSLLTGIARGESSQHFLTLPSLPPPLTCMLFLSLASVQLWTGTRWIICVARILNHHGRFAWLSPPCLLTKACLAA